jgi:hypothetical protein
MQFQQGHLQDIYDIMSGKTTAQKLMNLVQSEGFKKAARLKNPLVQRDSFVGHLVPAPFINLLEPLYFNLREYTAAQTVKTNTRIATNGQKLVATLKEMAPAKVTNILELILVMVIFFWIIIISKLLKIAGQNVVDLPRLTEEDKELKQLAR